MRENGRSMVEMLGVLAIIGVLSVGAIAGYSKAMMKYKLNKQAEAMNMLLNNAIQNVGRFPNNSTADGAEYYAVIMDKLGLLPDGIVFNQNTTTRLSDVFGNDIWVYAYPSLYGIGYNFTDSGNTKDVCLNLLNVYKANRTEIMYIVTDQRISEEDVLPTQNGSYYGDKFCTKDVKCIKNITLDDMDVLCNQCQKDSFNCRIYVVWQ